MSKYITRYTPNVFYHPKFHGRSIMFCNTKALDVDKPPLASFEGFYRTDLVHGSGRESIVGYSAVVCGELCIVHCKGS